jgi:hypothetical protein
LAGAGKGVVDFAVGEKPIGEAPPEKAYGFGDAADARQVETQSCAASLRASNFEVAQGK